MFATAFVVAGCPHDPANWPYEWSGNIVADCCSNECCELID